jgi:hypothetical protein
MNRVLTHNVSGDSHDHDHDHDGSYLLFGNERILWCISATSAAPSTSSSVALILE